MLYRVLLALQFFSRLPVKLGRAPKSIDLASALGYSPMVGVLIGAVGMAAGRLVVLASPEATLVAGVVVVGTWTALTGALHVDGLADVADGFLSGRQGEEAGRIMKDSRIGAMGAVAIVLVLVGKIGAVAYLADQGHWWAVAMAPVAARWSTVLVAWRCRPPEWVSSGLGHSMVGRFDWKSPALATGFLVIAGCLFSSLGWVVLVPAVLLTGSWLAIRANRLLGGVTGDVLGATIELGELAGLMAVVLAG